MLFLVLVADFFVLVLVFVNGIVIFSFLVIFVFVFVNENHTAVQWRKGMPYAIVYLRQYSGEKVCLMLSSISDSTVEKRYALCYRLGHL